MFYLTLSTIDFEAFMQSNFDISSFHSTPTPPTNQGTDQNAELLKQILEVQKQILVQLQTTAAMQDPSNRWRYLLARWNEDFPQLPNACKEVLPVVERAYGAVLSALADEIAEHDEPNHLENEFNLQDFLDRYGMRLGQLGNILNLLAPLADAASKGK